MDDISGIHFGRKINTDGFVNDIEKSELRYSFPSHGDKAIVFKKTGAELKAMLGVKKGALEGEKEILSAKMGFYYKALTEAGHKSSDGESYKRFNYYGNNNISEEDRVSMDNYNNLVYKCEGIKKDLDVCETMIANLEDKKNYPLTINQLTDLRKAEDKNITPDDVVKAEAQGALDEEAEVINRKGLGEGVEKAFGDLLEKGVVKQYYRTTKSGKKVLVKQHTDSRSKKEGENKGGEKLKNINAFLDKFPDAPTSWGEATDELPDLHNELAKYVEGYKGNVYESKGGTLPNNTKNSLKTRNKVHKKGIKHLIGKLSDKDFNSFYADHKHWFGGIEKAFGDLLEKDARKGNKKKLS